VSGEQLTLVAGYQTLYNNRAAVAGSMSMCSDLMMTQNESNLRFCKQLANWVFQESGVLRASNLRHNKRGESCRNLPISDCPNPENYKIEDHVEFYVDLELKREGKWLAFDASDIQLQFVMLEPYYTVFLEREAGTTQTYSYKFRVPERLGIFRFVIDYRRYGLTFLDEQCQVSVI